MDRKRLDIFSRYLDLCYRTVTVRRAYHVISFGIARLSSTLFGEFLKGRSARGNYLLNKSFPDKNSPTIVGGKESRWHLEP
jgi:hypothetical protein